ncbi:RNA 2',3'-cyclic phosphodiesterase [Candidatus Woesearchaeota archaeon]|nr:RNA 2',3'-cyclic phosphodiesterase [Candidatus Woesearchaeota archaeon]
MGRLFIGVPVSGETKSRVKALIESLSKTGNDFKWVSPENLHFTLKFLGEVENKKINDIIHKLTDLSQTHERFLLKVGKVGMFPDEDNVKVIWIGTESKEMISLMKKINCQLKEVRENNYAEEIPHLTLARVKYIRNKAKLREWLIKVKESYWEEMVVDKFYLYQSKLTPQGPIYSVVKEFRLV